MGDSQFIIAELISSPSLSIPDPDAALSAEQRAIGTAVQCMLEESLYFGAIIQMRWGVASSLPGSMGTRGAVEEQQCPWSRPVPHQHGDLISHTLWSPWTMGHGP